MIARLNAVLALLLVAACLARPGRQAVAADPPVCFDFWGGLVSATRWLDAPGKLVGTSGADVLVGSTGADVNEDLGDDDIICSEPIGSDGMDDRIDAGADDDTIGGSAQVFGGSGNPATRSGAASRNRGAGPAR